MFSALYYQCWLAFSSKIGSYCLSYFTLTFIAHFWVRNGYWLVILTLLMYWHQLSGTFAQLRKATGSFVTSIAPSIRLAIWNNPVPTGRIFHRIRYLSFFRKTVEKIQVSLKWDKNNGYFTWRLLNIFRPFLAQFFIEWEMYQTKSVDEIKTHILCSITFFRQSCRLWENVEKYGRAGQATDDNMTYSHCMLDT